MDQVRKSTIPKTEIRIYQNCLGRFLNLPKKPLFLFLNTVFNPVSGSVLIFIPHFFGKEKKWLLASSSTQ
jgi:hypothetical protein